MTAPTMTPEEIADARRLCEVATPGPWRSSRRGNQRIGDRLVGASEIVAIQRPWNPSAIVPDCPTTARFEDPDADFIAAARTGWPRALDALEAAQAEAKRWEGEHNLARAHAEALHKSMQAATSVREPPDEWPPPVVLSAEEVAAIEQVEEREKRVGICPSCGFYCVDMRDLVATLRAAQANIEELEARLAAADALVATMEEGWPRAQRDAAESMRERAAQVMDAAAKAASKAGDTKARHEAEFRADTIRALPLEETAP